MRWADLDMLGHVNNVVYADYLQEARADMIGIHAPRVEGQPQDGLVIVSHQMRYRKPLLFDFDPVLVETWVTEIKAATFSLSYEIFTEADGVREVYVEASSVLTPFVFETESARRLRPEEKSFLERYLEPAPVETPVFGEPHHTELGHYPLKVRFSDVDSYGHANNVQYFEFFQEGRVSFLRHARHGTLPEEGGYTPVVVAQADVTYRKPVLFRPEPYDVYSWLAKLGTKSAVIEQEIVDGGETISRGRYVMVFFDPKTGRAVELPADERAAFEELLP